jgi:predicted ATPase
MEEKLVIHNFGGLHDITVKVNESFTLFIGPQASGKSVISKLIYFFKGAINAPTYSDENILFDQSEYTLKLIDRFGQIFSPECWPESPFRIEYHIDEKVYILTGNKQENKIALIIPNVIIDAIRILYKTFGELQARIETEKNDVSKYLTNRELWKVASDVYYSKLDDNGIRYSQQFYVVDGRSFFSELGEAVFALLSENHSLDLMMTEFATKYSTAKIVSRDLPAVDDARFNELLGEVLKGKYLRENDRDYLLHSDNRKIEIGYASSGQQEALPLTIIMRYLKQMKRGMSYTIYIEEPETHLFPSSQKAIVELVAYVFNTAEIKIQVVMTTHSPYIMTSFNNLLQASDCVCEHKSLKDVVAIIPQEEFVNFNDIYAYELHDGDVSDLMDKEMQLISTTALDEISELISNEFGKLIDL